MTSRTPRSSQESEDLTLGLSEPDGARSASPRSTPMPVPSSPSDGLAFLTSETSWVFDPTTSLDQAPHATLSPPLKIGTGKTVDVGWAPAVLQPSGPEASPAKTSPSPASGPGSPESDPASPSPSLTLWSSTDLPPSSSRMYRDSSPRMAGETLGRSSVAWKNSGMGGPTGFLTLSSSECPSDDDGCSYAPSTLAQVLEPTAPQRFYLSARAATGILRRATRRGRELPQALHTALRLLAGTTDIPAPEGMAAITSSVRRLTPVECERLMAWPDGWTIAPWPSRSIGGPVRTTRALSRGELEPSQPPSTGTVTPLEQPPRQESARMTSSPSASTPTATDAAETES